MIKTILNISVIPNVQPQSFTDKVISPKPPVFIGVHEVALVTDKPVRLKEDPQYLIRPIQTIFYKKYKIQFITNGEHYLELIKYSSKVIIQQQAKEEQKGYITEITRELKGNNIYLVEISYYDLESEKVAEFLKSEYINAIGSENYNLYYKSGGFISTLLPPLRIDPEPESNSYSNNDVNILTKSVQRKTNKYTFFLNKSECDDLQDHIYTHNCTEGANTAKEICKIGITELNGSDIFKVEIDFVYDISSYYA